jgi:non-specific serine/threonine protein kinase/serine/threonine-protein kinase PknK
LWVLGLVAYFTGDLDEAQQRGEESLRISKEVEDWKLVGFLETALGVIALERGKFDDARRSFSKGLELSVSLGDRLNVALVLEALCRLATATSAWSVALKLGGAAAAIREQAGARSIPIWSDRVADAMAEAERVVGPETGRAAVAEGRALSFEEAVLLAQTAGVPRARPDAPPAGLTNRELEIAAKVAKGMTNREMAERLVLAQRTIEGHVENIRTKLGFHSRTQIAAWAVERKLNAKT